MLFKDSSISTVFSIVSVRISPVNSFSFVSIEFSDKSSSISSSSSNKFINCHIIASVSFVVFIFQERLEVS